MLLGARQFFERRGAPTPPLPYDAEVEYLESTGTQYIDTGYLPNSQSSVECDAIWTYADGRGNPTLFGARKNGVMFEILQGLGSSLYYQYGSQSPRIVSADYFERRHLYKVVANQLFLDGDLEITANPTTFSINNSLAVFALHDDGVASRFTLAKLFSLKIWDNGVFVRDFIPVRFTNELGQSEGAMYDRLGVGGMNPDGSPRTDGLYRNRGTGAFLYGPDKS